MYNGLTSEQHREIGDDLCRINRELTKIFPVVANAYPKNSRYSQQLSRALDALGQARSAGDNVSCTEHRDDWSTHWYYPGTRAHS